MKEKYNFIIGIKYRLLKEKNIHTYLPQHWFHTLVYPTMYQNKWHFVWRCKKHFDSAHFDRHLTSSSCSLPNLITCLSMQALARSISRYQSFLLRYTWVSSLVMRIYRPQYIDRVWRGSPSSWKSFFGILLLNVTIMNHCIAFNTTWPEEVPIFTCGLRSSFR